MSIRSLVVHVDEAEGSAQRAQATTMLASHLGAAAKALAVSVAPGDVFGPGAALLDDTVTALRNEVANRRIAEARQALEKARAASGMAGEVMQTTPDRVIVDVASRLRPADVVVLGPPRINGRTLDDDVFEAALFHSGRPVLVMPHDRTGSLCGRKVAIAWKNGREAARAIHEAASILEKAETVRFIVVHDKEDVRFYGADALERMEAALRARGVQVGEAIVRQQNTHVGEAIEQAAASFGADLLVMGAYGRWRMSEMLFGGVTQHILAEMALPLFLAH